MKRRSWISQGAALVGSAAAVQCPDCWSGVGVACTDRQGGGRPPHGVCSGRIGALNTAIEDHVFRAQVIHHTTNPEFRNGRYVNGDILLCTAGPAGDYYEVLCREDDGVRHAGVLSHEYLVVLEFIADRA